VQLAGGGHTRRYGSPRRSSRSSTVTSSAASRSWRLIPVSCSQAPWTR
jgi:hypothetical protein